MLLHLIFMETFYSAITEHLMCPTKMRLGLNNIFLNPKLLYISFPMISYSLYCDKMLLVLFSSPFFLYQFEF